MGFDIYQLNHFFIFLGLFWIHFNFTIKLFKVIFPGVSILYGYLFIIFFMQVTPVVPEIVRIYGFLNSF